MTFGLIAINDSSYVQIDSEKPRLCAVHRGNYTSSSRVSVITFPMPITTSEPPCIFLRNSPERAAELYTDITITGGQGNWTGFRITALTTPDRPAGKWFAAVFASVAESDYGIRLWDEGSKVVYDSGATPVIFTRANHSWSFSGRVQISPVSNGYCWENSHVAPLLEDEYFMVNPFSRGLLTPDYTGWTPVGLRFSYFRNRLEVYGITALGAWSNMGAPGAVFARLPGT